jgi:glycosyltransferase involved in cell wall biosynthesis
MKKKAWHLLSNPWNSAITEYALSASLALSLENYENVLTPLEGSPAELRGKALGIKVFPVKSFSPFFWFKLRAFYQSFRPEVVFLYGGKETSFSRFFKDSKVIRFRGDARDLEAKPLSLYYKLTQSHISAVVTPCDVITHRLKSSKIPCRTIPLGVNTKKFHFQKTTKESDRLNLHLIARLDPIKGHRDFFKLYSLLLRTWKKQKKPFLHILGEEKGVPVKELRDYAASLGLVLDVDFQIIPYRIDNIENQLAKSDLVVIPSLGSEVICRVAEEALLCGVRIFVSGVGALEECVKENFFGASYRKKDEKETLLLLQDTLEGLLQEGAEVREQRAFLAKKFFSLDTMGKALDSLVKEIT